MGLRQDIDAEIESHGDWSGLVLLVPEDGWSSLLAEAGVEPSGGETARYRGVELRRGAVTAVIPADGF